MWNVGTMILTLVWICFFVNSGVAQSPKNYETYLNLTCYKGYDSLTFNAYTDVCNNREDTESELVRKEHMCTKACVYHQTEMIVLGRPDDKFALKLLNAEKVGFYSSLQRLPSIISDNNSSIKTFAKKIWLRCNTIVRKLNSENVPCGEWDDLYKCIEDQLACGRSTGNSIAR